MKSCRNPHCKKEVRFWDWLIQKRCCVDCWMINFELPKLDKFISNPKNKEKFEDWKRRKSGGTGK